MLVTERRWIDLIELWLTWLLAGNCKPGTIKVRAHYLGNFAARYRARLPEGIDLDDLTAFVGRDGWKPETRKSARASVVSFFAWMALTGRIPRDPAAGLPPVRVPAAQPRPVPVATFADAVLRTDPRTRLILQLGRFGGLRRAEVAQAHTRDVAGRWLHVHGKGGKERRVPLHPVLLEQLRHVPEGWLFPGPFGHLSPDHVGRLASRALPPGWTLHTCRHRAGTDMYAVRRDIRAVQEILGHASVRTTQLYVQVDDDDLVAAVLGIPA
jgi:integrase/recombinase XerC